jgi:hypothetical protein
MKGPLLLFTVAQVARGAELCDISLTPSQLMMASFDDGAQTTKYTNLRVECKSLYRRSASEVMKVDVPLRYKQCSNNEAEYDPVLDNCMQFQCPSACSIYDSHCAQRQTDLLGPLTDFPKFAEALGEDTDSFVTHDTWDEVSSMAHDWHNVGNIWWDGDNDNRYEVVHTAVDGCGELWDHEGQHRDQCRCGIVKWYRAKDPNNRHEWDHPPHAKTHTDDYLLRSHKETRFNARKFVGSECQSDQAKRQEWLSIFPDFNKTWAMPGFMWRWATENPRMEWIPGKNDNWMKCGSGRGFSPELVGLCEGFRTGTPNVAIFFGHGPADHLLDQHCILTEECGANWAEDKCRDETAFAFFMKYTQQWSKGEHFDGHDDGRMQRSGYTQWCQETLLGLKSMIANNAQVFEKPMPDTTTETHQHHHDPRSSEEYARDKKHEFMEALRDAMRYSYVVVDESTGEKSYHYRTHPSSKHGAEVPIATYQNGVVDYGHMWPDYSLPAKFGEDCYSFTEYSDSIRDYRRRQQQDFPNIIKPVWNCSAPVTIPQGSVMLAPPTTDPAHSLLRLLKREGVETKLQILESAEISSAKVNLFVMHEREEKGSIRKLGPSLAELKSACKVKLNMYFDEQGRRSINNNKWIQLKDLPERPPNCDAPGVEAANVEFQATLDSLSSAANVQCNNTQSRMLASSKKATNDEVDAHESAAEALDSTERKLIMQSKFHELKQRLKTKYSAKKRRLSSARGKPAPKNARFLLDSEELCEELWLEYVEDHLDPARPVWRNMFQLEFNGNPSQLAKRKEDFVGQCVATDEGSRDRQLKRDDKFRHVLKQQARVWTESRAGARAKGVNVPLIKPESIKQGHNASPSTLRKKPSRVSQRTFEEQVSKSRLNFLLLRRNLQAQAHRESLKQVAKRQDVQKRVSKFRRVALFSSKKARKRVFGKKKSHSPFARHVEAFNAKKLDTLGKERARLLSIESMEKLGAMTAKNGAPQRVLSLKMQRAKIDGKISSLKQQMRDNERLARNHSKRDYASWTLSNGSRKNPKMKSQAKVSEGEFRELFTKIPFHSRKGSLSQPILSAEVFPKLQRRTQRDSEEDCPPPATFAPLVDPPEMRGDCKQAMAEFGSGGGGACFDTVEQAESFGGSFIYWIAAIRGARESIAAGSYALRGACTNEETQDEAAKEGCEALFSEWECDWSSEKDGGPTP